MKKTLLLLSALLLSTSIASAQPQDCPPPPGDFPPPPPCMGKQAPPKVSLEKKLNLSEAQIKKAKELRMNAHKQIEPLFNQLRTKEDQKRALVNGGVDKKEQLQLIETLNNDISSLRHKIRDIKVQNDKDFEAILTAKQKQTLEKIKIEHRKKFEKNHKCFERPCP